MKRRDHGSMDEHQRKDPGGNTDNHSGSPRSRELERHPLLQNGRPRKSTQIWHRGGPIGHLLLPRGSLRQDPMIRGSW